MCMTQKDRFCAYFISFLIFFGVLFGNILIMDNILPGVNYVYKALVIILAFYTIFYVKNHEVDKSYIRLTIFIISYFGFTLLYSLWIKSNTTIGILQDLNLLLSPKIQDSNLLKNILNFSIICLLIEVVARFIYGTLDVAGGTLIDGNGFLYTHPVYFGDTTVSIAILYLLVNKERKNAVLKFLLILSIGLFSFRSKIYGIWGISILLFVFFKNLTLKINIRNIIVGAILGAITFALAYAKIYKYFGVSMEEGADVITTRYALYIVGIEIIKTYLPFGTGLCSFATGYSGTYYSDIYYLFGMNELEGLTPDDPAYVSDTFFPALAQFGIVGTFLFLYFWYYIVKRANVYKNKISNKINIEYLLIVVILCHIFIASTSSSLFYTHNGHVCMIVLGLCLSSLKQKYEFEIRKK